MGDIIKICENCNKEFSVSKFNQYFTQCKICRKGRCKSTLRVSGKYKKKNRNKKICKRCYDHFTISDKTGIWQCPLCRKTWTIIIKGWSRLWTPNGPSESLSNRVYYNGKFIGYMTEYGDLRRMINEHSRQD